MTFLSLNTVEHLDLRRDIITTANRMNTAGINYGKSGNVSARTPEGSCGNGFLVTPTGIEYDVTKPEQIVLMDWDGEHQGSTLPSSEWRFHRDIYLARPDVGAVVHTHAIYATTLACQHRGIPPFHYMVAIAGGRDIRCAPYATFGTQALSEHAVAALEGRRACLLAHHGMIACGSDLKTALMVAIEVEVLAKMYWHALQLGELTHLSDAEMDVVIEKFKTYGQQPAPAN